MNRAIKNLPPKEDGLSPPSKDYLLNIQKVTSKSCETEEEKVQQQVDVWHFMSGFKTSFDEDLYRSLFRECLSRTKRSDILMNHFLASARSEDLVRSVPKLVRVPTLIIQGSEDPFFGPDHGEALACLGYCFCKNTLN